MKPSVDDSEHVARGEDQVVLAAVLGVDHDVADAHIHRDAGAGVIDATRAHRKDLALLGLFLGGVRNDDAGRGRRFSLAGLNDDLVLERLDVHARPGVTSTFWGLRRAGRLSDAGFCHLAVAGVEAARAIAGTLVTRVPISRLLCRLPALNWGSHTAGQVLPTGPLGPAADRMPLRHRTSRTRGGPRAAARMTRPRTAPAGNG